MQLPPSLEWHVLIIIEQFTGHPLPVNQFVTVPWDFNPVHIVSQTRLRNLLPITGERNMQLRRLWNGMFGRVIMASSMNQIKCFFIKMIVKIYFCSELLNFTRLNLLKKGVLI